MSTPVQTPALDHLVILADTLEQGVSWCERTLGVTPGPGGQHVLFGTHNRLLAIGSQAFPTAYLEVIAVDPKATPRPGRLRWFDMDDGSLLADVKQRGPRLIHWVARVPEVQQAAAHWMALGIDRGKLLQADRMTPEGLLQWRITVRDDGQRLMDGCLPTLIEWGQVHPATTMSSSGLGLRSLTLHHPDAGRLRRALASAGLTQPAVEVAVRPRLVAKLMTPRGAVEIAG